MCILSNDIYDYYNVAQGKVTIPNVDDGEECLLTDVSVKKIIAIFRVILWRRYKTLRISNIRKYRLYANYILAGYIFHLHDSLNSMELDLVT